MHPSPHHQSDTLFETAEQTRQRTSATPLDHMDIGEVLARDAALAGNETWLGECITIHGSSHELPHEIYQALERAASKKSTTVDDLVAAATNHLKPSAVAASLRRIVQPYLPSGWQGSPPSAK